MVMVIHNTTEHIVLLLTTTNVYFNWLQKPYFIFLIVFYIKTNDVITFWFLKLSYISVTQQTSGVSYSSFLFHVRFFCRLKLFFIFNV